MVALWNMAIRCLLGASPKAVVWPTNIGVILNSSPTDGPFPLEKKIGSLIRSYLNVFIADKYRPGMRAILPFNVRLLY
jgi:hypothetical protein